jgi:nicotinate-nucleotide adenylyltransferase
MDPFDRIAERAGLRLGIMGGTFDPIHIGHLVTADEALQQFALDDILFMPSGQGPHKPRQTSPAELRYLMVSIATASHPHFWVSRLEIDSPGLDYTADTLATLHRMMSPDVDLYFITGADAVLDILTWKDPERILSLCTLIAATRPGYDLGRLSSVLSGLGRADRVRVMEIPGLAVSSSMIRERAARGETCRYLVTEGVRQLIEKTGCYAPTGRLGS